MEATPQAGRPRIALLIDAENAHASQVERVLNEVRKVGAPNVRRIFGDWTNPQLAAWKDKINKFAIQPVQQFRYTTGKNSSDSALIIDAMDLLHSGNFESVLRRIQ